MSLRSVCEPVTIQPAFDSDRVSVSCAVPGRPIPLNGEIPVEVTVENENPVGVIVEATVTANRTPMETEQIEVSAGEVRTETIPFEVGFRGDYEIRTTVEDVSEA